MKGQEEQAMDRNLRKLLADCLRELEVSGDIEACLRRYPDRAQELRPYLERAASLSAQGLADPQPTGQSRGRQRLLSRLAELDQQSGGGKQMTIFNLSLVRAAAMGTAAIFLVGGTAFASAALGGPNLVPGVMDDVPVAGPVLDALNITDSTPDEADSHIDGAGDGADLNALEGNDQPIADDQPAATDQPTATGQPEPTSQPVATDQPLADTLLANEVCNSGPGGAGVFRLEISGDDVKIDRGTVVSFDGTTLVINSTNGSVTAVLSGGSEIDGDLSTAIEVRLEGTLLGDGSIVIDKVKVLCPNTADDSLATPAPTSVPSFP
jgi:hypothetical protein